MVERARASMWLREVAEAGIHRSAAKPGTESVRTISGCARAILEHHGIDPAHPAGTIGSGGSGLVLRDVVAVDHHLTMTILLPMPYGTALMTIATGKEASVTMPGFALSPAVARAALGRPVGRLAGHPAFERLDGALVSRVEQSSDTDGRSRTILHFVDRAEPVDRLLGMGSLTAQ